MEHQSVIERLAASLVDVQKEKTKLFNITIQVITCADVDKCANCVMHFHL